jgi:hypothetical protein
MLPSLHILRLFGVLPFKINKDIKQSPVRLQTSPLAKFWSFLVVIICVITSCYILLVYLVKIIKDENAQENFSISLSTLISLFFNFTIALSILFNFINKNVDFINEFSRKVTSATFICTSSTKYNIQRWYLLVFIAYEIISTLWIRHALDHGWKTTFLYVLRVLIVCVEQLGVILSISLFYRFNFINENIMLLYNKPRFYIHSNNINNSRTQSSVPRLQYLKKFYKSLGDALQLLQQKFSFFLAP